jgi:hypothetical protein
MRYRIDQDQLWEFLARQARLVERLPVEAAEAAADGYSDGLDDSEREAVWLAAGVATHRVQKLVRARLGYGRFLVESVEGGSLALVVCVCGRTRSAVARGPLRALERVE